LEMHERISISCLPMRVLRLFLFAAILALFPSNAHSHVKKTIEPGLRAEIEGGKKIYLTACAVDEHDTTDWPARVLANPEKQTKFLSGKCLKVPLAELAEKYQIEVMKTLFKDDSYNERGWTHKVTYISLSRRGGETLWNISEWFTGDAQNYKKILKHNGMSRRAKLYKGTKINIPLELLGPASVGRIKTAQRRSDSENRFARTVRVVPYKERRHYLFQGCHEIYGKGDLAGCDGCREDNLSPQQYKEPEETDAR